MTLTKEDFTAKYIEAFKARSPFTLCKRVIDSKLIEVIQGHPASFQVHLGLNYADSKSILQKLQEHYKDWLIINLMYDTPLRDNVYFSCSLDPKYEREINAQIEREIDD